MDRIIFSFFFEVPLNCRRPAGTHTSVHTQTHVHVQTHMHKHTRAGGYCLLCIPVSFFRPPPAFFPLYFALVSSPPLLSDAVCDDATWGGSRAKPGEHHFVTAEKKKVEPTCSLVSFLFLASPLIARRRFLDFFFSFLPSLVTCWKPFVSEMSNCHRVVDRLTDNEGLITVANGGGQTACHYRLAGCQIQRSILHLSVLNRIPQSSDWLALPVLK